MPRLRPAIASAVLDGEVVLYDKTTKALHHLNPTATVIWSCFDGATSLADIAAELASAYMAGTETILGDIVDLARSLGRQGLLVGVAGDQETDVRA